MSPRLINPVVTFVLVDHIDFGVGSSRIAMTTSSASSIALNQIIQESAMHTRMAELVSLLVVVDPVSALAHGLFVLYAGQMVQNMRGSCYFYAMGARKLDLMHIEDEVFAAADSDKSKDMTVDEIQKLLIQQVRYLTNRHVAACSQLAVYIAAGLCTVRGRCSSCAAHCSRV